MFTSCDCTTSFSRQWRIALDAELWRHGQPLSTDDEALRWAWLAGSHHKAAEWIVKERAI